MNTVVNIFLVDDDVMDREFFISALSCIDNVKLFDVAKNGREALAALEKAPVLPSLIFMDVDMPMMNGIECLKNILMNPKTRNIPVVMLTSTDDYIKKSGEIGARGLIIKPDDEPTLIHKIRQAVADFC